MRPDQVHGMQLCRKGEIDTSQAAPHWIRQKKFEELNDNFIIEFEDYELQQDEMEEGFTCTSCMPKNDATAYPFCVCCGFKASQDENVCIL